jgi:hypothetical protein
MDGKNPKNPAGGTPQEPTLGEDDLMPWERGEGATKAETLQALDDLIAQEDDLSDEDDQSGRPRRKPKKKTPAPSEEDDEDDADDDLEDDEADVDDEADDDDESESDEEEEEADAAQGDDEEDDESELEELDLPMDAIVEIPVGGGETEQVTLEEALNRTMRAADYTRKTQATAAERKKYVDAAEQTLQVREALGQQLLILEAALAEDGTPPDHWTKLRVENPEQFANEYAAYEATQDKLKKVRAAIAQQQEEGVEEAKAAHAARVVEERNKLTEAIPDWVDEKVFDEALGTIQTFLVDTYGANDKELEQIYDHRFILMARDAMLYRRAKSKGKEKIKAAKKKGARILKPGASSKSTTTGGKKGKKSGSKKVKAFKRARERSSRTGSVKDAAAAFLALEDAAEE